MEQPKVEPGIWMHAPREWVWQAITDPADLAKWLLPPASEADMRRGAHGNLIENFEGKEAK